MAGQDTLRDSVERELTSVVNEPDGGPTLRRLAAFELSRYATGTWRLLSLAVLSKTG